jgi:hypothetical protein
MHGNTNNPISYPQRMCLYQQQVHQGGKMHKIHSEFSAHRKDIGIRRNFGRNDHICCWILIKTFLTSHTPNYFLFLHVIEVLEDGGETRVTIGTTSIGIGGGGVLGSRNIEVFSPFNMTPRSMFSLDEYKMSVERG